jgi:hypothetical protein
MVLIAGEVRSTPERRDGTGAGSVRNSGAITQGVFGSMPVLPVLPVRQQAPRPSGLRRAQARRSRRLAFSFRISGCTSGLKPASAKSFIQRSGVISG